jgi:hypothetical protein
MLRRAALGFALVAALTTWPTSYAHAQSASEIAAAKEWFAEGIRLEGDAKWKEALDRFKRAQAVKRTPAIDFHVGLCEARSGDLVAALVDLDRAVKSAREKHDEKVESAASSELGEVRARVPSLEIDAPSDKAERVMVDGASFATATLGSPVPMNPGEHVIVVDFGASRGGRVEKKVTLAERETKKVAFDPPPPSSASTTPIPPVVAPTNKANEAPSASPPAEPVNASTSSSNKTLPWVLVGGGGALVAGGVVFFLLRQGEISTLDQACPTRTHCDPSLMDDQSKGSTYTTLSFALGGVGIAAAAVGVVMLAGQGSSSGGARAVVVPSALPGGGGASLVGRF